jgi:uncharacterized membrane protein
VQDGYQQQEQQTVYEHEYHRPLDSMEMPVHHNIEAPVHLRHQMPQEPYFSAPLPHTDARVAAALCYSCGWLSGLLFALFARENRYVRFHAWQALLFFGGINMLDVMAIFLISRHSFYSLFVPHVFVPFLFLGFMLLNFIGFVGWLVAMFQAYRGAYYKLPFVGDMLAKSFYNETMLK